ncbi:hypothetical protein AALP_AA1G124400 [Arabis alpina]|uniref:Uncharacterized protein n=1 Tax=Arabis alpina TaxID=50452 RepID=A0A087HMS5_ARAAL|nr:hypothetical protein AALP_AA1G124400 [Arabis alpina]
MSGKRFNPYDDPPNASSDEEEDEVENSIGDEGYSSEEEHEDIFVTKPALKNLESVLKTHVSDSESEPEEESETEKENPKPSVVKPITEINQDSTKGKSCSKSDAKMKRSSSEIDAAASRDAKKVKRVSGEEEKKSGGEETKKTYFQRVWSQEDEIAVLQKIIDYKTDNGVSPLDDTNAFYLLVRSFISFDVSKIQFNEKLRSLKKKFENNLGKSKNGEEPSFLKAHDRKAFDLSKLIWGVNGIAPESTAKANGKSKKKSGKSKKVESVVSSLANGKSCEDKQSFLVKSLARFGMDDLVAQQGWISLESEDKKRYEEQWKAMQLREFEFYSQKSGFLHGVVTKIAESLRRKP